MRIKLSSSDKKNLDTPGSPCLPARPLSWLSILLDSCRSVPITYNPPSDFTFLLFFTHSSALILSLYPPRTISVPRPAILVAIVIEFRAPAF